MQVNQLPPLLSVKDTIKATGLPERFLRDGLREGRIPHIRVGVKYLINFPLLMEKIDKESLGKADEQNQSAAQI